MSLTTTPATSGGFALIPQTMDEAMRLAEMMARGKLVPRHLQGSPADCFMVVEQATRWRMSPFAVAQATSVIQGKLMYEGKLVAAAVHTCGAVSSRIDYEYTGEGPSRAVIASAVRVGETEPRSVTVTLKDARTDNKMWNTQPDQQLAYHAARVWARRWTPEVILGVYAPEEMGPVVAADPHNGATIEATAEPVAEAPAEPPRRTLKQFLDELEVKLRDAATWDEVAALANAPETLKAQEVARNGLAERLSDMLDAARERTMHPTEQEAAHGDV